MPGPRHRGRTDSRKPSHPGRRSGTEKSRQSESRSSTDVESVVNRHLTALNGRNLEQLISFYAEDAILELPASPKVEGREAIRRAFEVFFEQWEEESDYEHIVVSGNDAAVEGVTTGRHRTLHLRIPGRIPMASREYRHPFAAFFTFRDGRIIRQRVYYDARDLVKQLLG